MNRNNRQQLARTLHQAATTLSDNDLCEASRQLARYGFAHYIFDETTMRNIVGAPVLLMIWETLSNTAQRNTMARPSGAEHITAGEP